MRAAKERKRLNPQPLPDESDYIAPIFPRVPFATVTIAIGNERVTFRVHRYDTGKLVAFGKRQSASTIGRRVALVLENLL